MPAGQIHNAEAEVGEGGVRIAIEPVFIGPAMADAIGHAAQHGFVAGVRRNDYKTCNTAHMFNRTLASHYAVRSQGIFGASQDLSNTRWLGGTQRKRATAK